MFDHLRSTYCSKGATWKSGWKTFFVNITTKRILDVGYWWPTLFKDTHDFCKSYESYQKIGGLKTKSLAKLVTTLVKEPSFFSSHKFSPISKFEKAFEVIKKMREIVRKHCRDVAL